MTAWCGASTALSIRYITCTSTLTFILMQDPNQTNRKQISKPNKQKADTRKSGLKGSLRWQGWTSRQVTEVKNWLLALGTVYQLKSMQWIYPPAGEAVEWVVEQAGGVRQLWAGVLTPSLTSTGRKGDNNHWFTGLLGGCCEIWWAFNSLCHTWALMSSFRSMVPTPQGALTTFQEPHSEILVLQI